MTTRSAVLAAVLLAACADPRPVDSERVASSCPTWKEEIGARFSASCASCHSGEDPAAGYDVSSYFAAIAEPGRDALERVLDPASASAPHRPLVAHHPLVSRWAGECDVAYVHSAVHPAGIMDPADDDFHGQEVVRQGFNMELCASCHGADFRGGLAQADCTTCHSGPGGPTGCTTCHGTPPSSGAHLAHATSPRLGKPLDCAQCHRVPEVYTDVGHVLDAAGAVDPAPAELTFGTLASATIDPPNRRGPPSIDHGTGTCSNVHCHGDTFGDTAAAFPKPTWTGGPEQGACGACHGRPPSDHGPEAECRLCHTFTPATHVNGMIDAGDAAAGCSRCHGGPENPRGGTFPLGGAHVAHVEGTHRLRAPLGCAECHVTPATVNAPGHLDTALPAEVDFGDLAETRGASPTYTVPPGTCSGVYCHGPAQLSWNDAPPGAAACGTCHGVPPATQSHAQATDLRTCATCHGNVVDGFGNIIGLGLHINGRIDVAR